MTPDVVNGYVCTRDDVVGALYGTRQSQSRFENEGTLREIGGRCSYSVPALFEQTLGQRRRTSYSNSLPKGCCVERTPL